MARAGAGGRPALGDRRHGFRPGEGGRGRHRAEEVKAETAAGGGGDAAGTGETDYFVAQVTNFIKP